MVVRSIPVDLALPNIEARPVKKEAVEALAESMNCLGLLNPITVFPTVFPGRGRPDNPGFGIIAGHHRVQAAKTLGWESIDAFVLDDIAEDDHKRQRMIEISENLHRAELSVQERAKLVAEWAELTGEKLRQLDAVSGGRGNEGGVRKAARELGIPEPNVRRAVKIASLSPEAQAVAVETGQDDIQTALLEAARLPADQQAQFLRQRAKPPPPVEDDYVKREKWLGDMIRRCNKVPDEWVADLVYRLGV